MWSQSRTNHPFKETVGQKKERKHISLFWCRCWCCTYFLRRNNILSPPELCCRLPPDTLFSGCVGVEKKRTSHQHLAGRPNQASQQGKKKKKKNLIKLTVRVARWKAISIQPPTKQQEKRNECENLTCEKEYQSVQLRGFQPLSVVLNLRVTIFASWLQHLDVCLQWTYRNPPVHPSISSVLCMNGQGSLSMVLKNKDWCLPCWLHITVFYWMNDDLINNT